MNSIERLIEHNRLTKLRIAVVGDAMTDIYIHGYFGACQEGCYKFIETSRATAPGGAANAMHQLDNWNTCVELWSANATTSEIKTRFIVDDQYTFRHDTIRLQPNASLDADRANALEHLKKTPYDAILISDYDKGFLTVDFIREIIETTAQKRFTPVVVDAKREPSIYNGATLKCNTAYFNKFPSTNDYKWHTVITDGAALPHFKIEYDKWERAGVEAPKIIVRNHVGAGDCFAAHLTLALAHKLDIDHAVAIAHSAGRIYVQHEHNRAPYPHEIAKDMAPTNGKIIQLGDLAALRHSVPGKLVFTNGVFRLPHAGHAWLMDWAKQQGDVLVVGINTDESAHRLRSDQTILPLAERIQIFSSLSAVDWIVPFDGDTPIDAITNLRPDILIKGHDYEGQSVPGSDLVPETRFGPRSPFVRHASDIIS